VLFTIVWLLKLAIYNVVAKEVLLPFILVGKQVAMANLCRKINVM